MEMRKVGHPKGQPHSAEHRKRIGEGLLRHNASRRDAGLPVRAGRPQHGSRLVFYKPPPEFQEMYDKLKSAHGRREAERLMRDHIAVVRRRAEAKYTTGGSNDKRPSGLAQAGPNQQASGHQVASGDPSS
jgi:hypothetical protein